MKNDQSVAIPSKFEEFASTIKIETNLESSIYIKTTNKIPSSVVYHDISSVLFKQKVIENFSHLFSQIGDQLIYDKDQLSYDFDFEMCLIDEDIMLKMDYISSDELLVQFLYAQDSNKEIIKKLKETAISCIVKKVTSGKISLLVKSDDNALILRDFDLVDNDLDFSKNYNDDFIPFHNKVVERLNKKSDKGILLLYGLPGAGKTTYIRHITKKVDKQFIYITPEIASCIASPEFIKFLMDYPNSVLVIEDAEMLIGNRKNNSNPVITNLLNLSDGMLSDCLNIQIVCTFNMPLSMIDKAFLRKGRLIDLYYFDKLEQSKTQQLLMELGHGEVKTQALTLAEIYNYDKDDELEDQPTSRQIGFNRS